MKRKIISNVFSIPKRYPILICDELLSDSLKYDEFFCSEKGLIITTPTVFRLYKDIIEKISRKFKKRKIEILSIDEEKKDADTVIQVCELASQFGLSKKDTIVSICGGCCQDVITTAASIYKRGIDVVRIPTTLIGAIDAGIGIKSSLNFLNQKSSLGLFHRPKAVLVETDFLRSLPKVHILCGVSEIIKMGIISDLKLFFLLERTSIRLGHNNFYVEKSKDCLEILFRSIKSMISELKKNFYEDKTFERLVDFGHTFSNVLESDSSWKIPHGFAVAIDIALSSYISYRMKLLSIFDLNRVLNLFIQVGIPIYSKYLTYDCCTRALEKAKSHRGGDINLVLPNKIGSGIFIKQESESFLKKISDGIDYLSRREFECQLNVGYLKNKNEKFFGIL